MHIKIRAIFWNIDSYDTEYSQDSYQDYSCSIHYRWGLIFYSRWKPVAWPHHLTKGFWGS